MYTVVDPSTGQKYGPADLPTLNLWASEGRLTPNTILEDPVSGIQVRAGQLPGLVFGGPVQETPPTQGAPREPYYSSNYQRPFGSTFGGQMYGSDADANIKQAWIWIAVGFFCCPLLYIPGLHFAKMARNAGHPVGSTAYTIALVMLCINGAILAFYLVMMIIMMASGAFT